MRALMIIALFAACERDQWVISVTTDSSAPTWGDRLLLEVLDGDGNLACADCRREVAVDNSSFPVSFGVPIPNSYQSGQRRVRTRFYRASQVGADGLPQGKNLIDEVWSLDPLGLFGHVDHPVLPLWALCWGQPADVAGHMSCGPQNIDDPANATIAFGPEASALDVSLPSQRPGNYGAEFRRCAGADVPAGMSCIDADAFVLGTAHSAGVDSDVPVGPDLLRQPVLSFLLDQEEMTVGKVRKLGLSFSAQELWKSGDPGVPESCTFHDDGSHDDWPINCISIGAAKRVCDALDEQLPDEGQWEAAARNGAEGTRYPWGDTPPTCDDAYVAVDDSCPRSGPAHGSFLNDTTKSGIHNLGGNLSEWVEGILVDYTSDCWLSFHGDSGVPFYSSNCVYDPSALAWTGPWPHRGGSWDRRASSAAGFARFSSPDGAPSPSIGFRCARPLPTCATLCQELVECQGGSQSICERSCKTLHDLRNDADPNFPYGRAGLDLLQFCSAAALLYDQPERCQQRIACNDSLPSMMSGLPKLETR